MINIIQITNFQQETHRLYGYQSIRDFTLTSRKRGAYLHINRKYMCDNFGRLFLGHHYYIFGLSELCLGLEKKNFKKNNAFSL